MAEHNIMAIVINHRTSNAPKFQEVLTKHGCSIKMRLGLHEAGNVCSEEGLIILQLAGDKGDIKSLEDALNGMDGIKAKTLSISSD